MHVFDRYIARQILISTLFAVVVLSVVLVLGQIFKKLLDALVEGVLPPSAVLKFMGYAFPMSLSYTIPWGLLTAVLLTFGRLSADNEFLAMRMAGLSLRRICLPVFLVAGGFSLLCLWINTTVAPHSLREIDRMTKLAVVRDPRVLFIPDKTIGEDRLPGHLMYLEQRNGDDLKNLQIVRLEEAGGKGQHGRPSLMIFSKEGKLRTDAVGGNPVIELGARDNTCFLRNEPAPLTAEERARLTPEEIAERERRLGTQEHTAPRIVDLGTQNSPTPPITGRFDARFRVDTLTMSELRRGLADPGLLARENPGMEVPEPVQMRSEWHRRLSFSLACFILALAGIPFGIGAHRRETSSGFVLSLIVGIGYFSLIMLAGLWSKKPDYHPHIWVWLPNVVFGVMGLLLFWRMQKK